MRTILLLSLLLAPQDDLSKQIDEIVTKTVKDDTPGVAVLVIKNGEVVHKKGYGLANLEHKVAITSETVFDLASVSKQFTAMAVMILADRGELAFADDIRKVLPEMPETDKERPIRIEDLLHHVSGIHDYLDFMESFKGDPNTVKNEGVLKILVDKKLDFPTGTKWAYSNSNYCLLGLILERVTKKTFREVMKKEIFEPLGMKSAWVFDDATQVIKNRAYGYERRKKEWRYAHSDWIMTGDGTVMLSLEDFVLWDKALRDGKLVKAETLKLAWAPGKLDSGKEHTYGFGWNVTTKDGKLTVEHSGGWAGTSTYIVRYVDEGVTAVALSNAPGFVDPTSIARKAAKLWR